MKMPPTMEETSDNGVYEYEESSLSITNENIENTPADEFDAPPENDFSEYMWMENEEEFDKEVMQRLEEEALMEECIAYMNTENSPNNPYPSQSNSEGAEDGATVANSKLNPEAAEFVPSGRREPPVEGNPDTTSSP